MAADGHGTPEGLRASDRHMPDPAGNRSATPHERLEEVRMNDQAIQPRLPKILITVAGFAAAGALAWARSSWPTRQRSRRW